MIYGAHALLKLTYSCIESGWNDRKNCSLVKETLLYSMSSEAVTTVWGFWFVRFVRMWPSQLVLAVIIMKRGFMSFVLRCRLTAVAAVIPQGSLLQNDRKIPTAPRGKMEIWMKKWFLPVKKAAPAPFFLLLICDCRKCLSLPRTCPLRLYSWKVVKISDEGY